MLRYPDLVAGMRLVLSTMLQSFIDDSKSQPRKKYCHVKD